MKFVPKKSTKTLT